MLLLVVDLGTAANMTRPPQCDTRDNVRMGRIIVDSAQSSFALKTYQGHGWEGRKLAVMYSFLGAYCPLLQNTQPLPERMPKIPALIGCGR